MLNRATALGFLTLFLGVASPTYAQSPADFYRGKTVTIVVGYSAGGGYDIYARAIGKRLGDHIPGKPTVITQNMPGAGSLTAANYLYNAAPKDGTVIATFARGMPMLPLLDPAKARFDPSKFIWLGSAADEVSVCGFMAQSKIKSVEDMKTIPFTVSGEGGGSDPDTYAAVVRELFGVKLKLVTGYPGANEMTLAMERGEVDGRCGWSYSAIKATRPQWLKDGTFKILLNMGMERSPALPDVPSVMELATNDRQRAIMKLVFSRQVFARPFAMTPAVPADRAAAMEKAFLDTLADPAFLEEASKLGLEISPVGGDVVEKLVADLNATPKDVIEETRKIVSAEP
jgi:tripartite-type tricarboxylate transporter receptor subunit TctC